jgi:peptidoglycan hydrolase-like protein with peptidoglycan-binding domain
MPTHHADLAAPRPWRESLQRSHERRDAARRARRRRFRGRGVSFVLCAVMVLGGGAALATGGGSSTSKPAATASASQSAIVAAQQKLGVAADGVVGPQTRRAVRRFQRRNGLVVDGVIGPQTLAALGISGESVVKAKEQRSGSGGGSPQLQKIAQCESGGDPAAISAGGDYRGKYQVSRDTWRAVGGKGDPAAASEAEQDRRAAILLERAGPSSWPNCA